MRRYIEKMTQIPFAVTRLIARHGHRPAGNRLSAATLSDRYTRADIELLASVDEAHETLSGPATRRIVEPRGRALRQAGVRAALAAISVAHLYNPAQEPSYRERRLNYVKTRPTVVSIGEDASPIREGQPAICAWTRCTRAMP